uniref:Uncharacterized protein n=1 Tax=viral metagenome TaxID=1070528 RepID=A0A2V0RA70_9ZZZZ
MFTFHRQSVNMPGRQEPVMPTGRLSIEEKLEQVDSLTILIENEGSMVSQINIGKDENGKTSVFMMNVNVPWENPLRGVRITYNRAFEDKINPNSPAGSEPMNDNSLCETLVKYEEETSKLAQQNVERKSMNDDTFEAALKALPKIRTPTPNSDIDCNSLYSEEELGDLQKFLRVSSVGKKYNIKVKSDGGLLADLKNVLSSSKSTKRNIYVITKIDDRDEISHTIVLSKTRPKNFVNVRTLPIGVDIWLTKHVPKFKVQSVNDIEYAMLQHVREALVSFFGF